MKAKVVTTLMISSALLGGVAVVPHLLNQPVVAHADSTTINAAEHGLKADESGADNVEALQKIIDEHPGQLTINVPKGKYYFGGQTTTEAVKLHSNITFNFEKDAEFDVTNGNRVNFVYPSPKAGYDGGIENVTWNNATFRGDTNSVQAVFTQSVNHAKNINFNNNTFDNCESPTGHYIDLDGSHNINVQGSTFTGFVGTKDYKEAIQTDYSNTKAMSYHNAGDKYDNLPTYDVHVTNNQFLPIARTSGTVKSYAPNPIGQHALYNHGKAGMIHDIYFTGNTVKDVKPLLSDDGANIHFRDVSNLYLNDNTFENSSALGSSNYIRLYNSETTLTMTNLNIQNNKFVNLNPDNRYVFLSAKSPKLMTNVNITNNKIDSTKSAIPFVLTDFGTNGLNIKDNNVEGTGGTQTKQVPKSVPVQDTQKLKIKASKKKNKQTNKSEKYYTSSMNYQTANMISTSKLTKKKFALYTHVKGHKGWNYTVPNWSKFSRKVFVDESATATSGKWYRIAFGNGKKDNKYWVRANGLSLSTAKKHALQAIKLGAAAHDDSDDGVTYNSGINTQHAQLSGSVASKNYALYTHVKGQKNWAMRAVNWSYLNKKRAYIDMRATGTDGTWYRVRFSTADGAKKYWLRGSGLDFDKITYEDYNRTLNLMQKYPVYSNVWDSPELAKAKGTTNDYSQRNVQVVKRAKRYDAKGNLTTYYQMSNGYWTRALAFQ